MLGLAVCLLTVALLTLWGVLLLLSAGIVRRSLALAAVGRRRRTALLVAATLVMTALVVSTAMVGAVVLAVGHGGQRYENCGRRGEDPDLALLLAEAACCGRES